MAYLYFNLSKYNTSGISYKDDGQIPKSKIQDNKIISTTSIQFKKPFKLHVRASKMHNNERIITKKTLSFSNITTLLDAVKEAIKIYEQMMLDSENKPFIKLDTLKPTMKFKKVWDLYIADKILEYANNSSKNNYDEKYANQFFDKWITPIADIPIKDIHRTDITKLKSKMKDKKGKPLADRTKLSIHQYINPVYRYFNLNSSFELKSPAVITKLDKISKNTREFDLEIDEIKELFLKLKEYPLSPYREVFIWLMHGRRRKEVLTLKWKDINLDKNIYTIRAINNKAKVDMTYTLTPRLRDTIEVISKKKEDFVFYGQKDKTKPLSENTLRNHWNYIKSSIVMHQIRSCIAIYLKNIHSISNEMTGYILGHTQNSTVTERYGTYGHTKLSDTLNLMLDKIFDDKYSKKEDADEKLKQLQILFPDKSIDQLKIFLES